MKPSILCVVGTTGSGKSGRAITEALMRGGEVISVDSRQVYRGLDIGTEKIMLDEMMGVPHHLIDIRDVHDPYSAGDFIADAKRLIEDITTRGKLPILAGGTYFYFYSLLNGLPLVPTDPAFGKKFELLSDVELHKLIWEKDPRRAAELDPRNRRRLIRALEIIEWRGSVPPVIPAPIPYNIEWILLDVPPGELKTRLDTRLKSAFERGLIEEVRRVREITSDQRLDELGLEYRIVGQYLRKERSEESLFPALSARLWQYARRQKAWLRKLSVTPATPTNAHV